LCARASHEWPIAVDALRHDVIRAASASAKPLAAAVSASRAAATSCSVDDGVTERERSAAIAGEAGCRFERAELPAQPVDAGCRLPGGREVQSCGCGHGPAKTLCSWFVLLIPETAVGVKAKA